MATKISQCKALMCNTVADAEAVACPKCGGKMTRSSAIRGKGIALTICGGAIVAMIGYAALYFVPLMVDPNAGGTTQFNGTPEEARMIVGVVCFVLLFGVFALINGIFQIVTGRRSRTATVVAMALGFVLAAGAFFAVRGV